LSISLFNHLSISIAHSLSFAGVEGDQGFSI
jgi:hypothetical protein